MNQPMKKLTEVLNRFDIEFSVSDKAVTVDDMAMWDRYDIEWDKHYNVYTLRIKREIPSWGGGRELETKKIVKCKSADDVVSAMTQNEEIESEY